MIFRFRVLTRGTLYIPQNGWADNVPYIASLTYDGERYKEIEREDLVKNKTPTGNIFHIQTLNAQGGNVILGNAMDVTQQIDNSVKTIELLIEEKAGDDKDVLLLLLEEAKSIAKRISEKEALPEKSGFFQRASKHFEKHGWFYGAIVQLIGTAAITFL